MASPDTVTLALLLRKRIDVIADHNLRDRDPAAHLEALKTVSQELEAEHHRLKGTLPPRLKHFLEQASYQKVLVWLEETR